MEKDQFNSRINRHQVSNRKNKWVIFIKVFTLLLIIMGVGLGVRHLYLRNDTSAKNPNSTKKIDFYVASGMSASQIGTKLEQKGLIKHNYAFENYLTKHNINDLKAGYFSLSASMNLANIAKKLEKSGSLYPISKGNPDSLLMREGETAQELAKTIAKKTKFSAKTWLATLNDKQYLAKLAKTYPELLSSALKAKNTKYVLEGYLYPATYNIKNVKSANDITTMMVSQMNTELAPYYEQIKRKGLTVQEILTLASLVEREAITQSDRSKVAGVFFNRIDKKMTLGSDIAVKYAMKNPTTNLSLKDIKIKSPYNLYVHTGYGPGPVNSPSLNSIKAVLNPVDRKKKYYYFIADLKTGKIYFSKTYAQHEKLNKKLSATNNKSN
ncbi:UPF0755 protein [Weissella beninensis]|nr:endolytic transglycosylase MltG [Periweissella beninensis]MBM7544233.1 UPF0755 protein [Periweissella beninensis]